MMMVDIYAAEEKLKHSVISEIEGQIITMDAKYTNGFANFGAEIAKQFRINDLRYQDSMNKKPYSGGKRKFAAKSRNRSSFRLEKTRSSKPMLSIGSSLKRETSARAGAI
jgi:hypothetical protein